MQPNQYYVRYIGEDAAEIHKGEIYQAEDLQDSKTMIGVLDRSVEWYAYPKELFQKAYAGEFATRYIGQLRTGEAQPCLECRIGLVSTEYDPKTSHSFRCNSCEFMIIID